MGNTLKERIEEGIRIIKSVNFEELGVGVHVINEDLYLSLQSYESKDAAAARYEAHEKYVDIQYIVEGVEAIGIAPVETMEADGEYSEEKDVIFFKTPEEAAKVVLTAGGYVVLYPEDAHQPGVREEADKPVAMKKIVGKVRV